VRECAYSVQGWVTGVVNRRAAQEYSQVHPTGISRAAACGLLLCAVRVLVLHRRVLTSGIVYFTVGFTDKSMSILLSREAWREVIIRIRTGPGVWVRYVTIRAEGRCVLGCWLEQAACSMLHARAHQHQGVGCCCSVCSRGSCHRGQVIHRRAPLQTTAPSVLLFAYSHVQCSSTGGAWRAVARPPTWNSAARVGGRGSLEVDIILDAVLYVFHHLVRRLPVSVSWVCVA
jgi:hypothetical protein